MIFAQVIKDKPVCWQAIWNRGIVSLFIILYFFNNITRYKHAVAGLMYITAIYYLVKNKKQIKILFKNNLALSVILLSAVTLYSVAISIDPHYSFNRFLNTIFEKLLIVSFVIPIILFKESKETAAKIIIYTLAVGIIPLMLVDGWQYIQEYQQGIMPLATFNHKYRSDALIFMAPALLFLWTNGNRKEQVAFVVLAIITTLMILGTLQRGTWLSILIASIIFFVCKKEWKIPLAAVTVLACVLSFAYITEYKESALLFKKIQQTSSSNRYGNGTQGSALDLILENPAKGYGFGENVYHRQYNNRVKDYPQWIARHSIGPHNLTLSFWFAAGIPGLLALWYLLCSTLAETIKGYRKSEGIIRDGWLLLAMVFVGNLVVRGAFETVSIENIAIVVGIALALRRPE
nr:O-antigen ligase RfaL [uncultured Enterobacter sp.]